MFAESEVDTRNGDNKYQLHLVDLAFLLLQVI